MMSQAEFKTITALRSSFIELRDSSREVVKTLIHDADDIGAANYVALSRSVAQHCETLLGFSDEDLASAIAAMPQLASNHHERRRFRKAKNR